MSDPLETWSLDREIVLVRVLNHPRDKVFAAWTDPAALSVWYGPSGLSIETHEADIREGGIWRFDMVESSRARRSASPTSCASCKSSQRTDRHGSRRGRPE